MKTIIVTGTPGTGKTTIAKKLSKKLGYDYIDVNKVIKIDKLREGYDRKRKSYLIDTKKLNKSLIKIIDEKLKDKKVIGIIIDSHLSHYLPNKYADLCIVTKCSLKKLETRLKKKRKYPKAKIRENLDCEIFDVCLNEAKELGHKTVVIDTTEPLNINKIAKSIKTK